MKNTENNLIFGKKNYYLIALGGLMVIIGFMLMSGGNSEDPSVYNPELFNFRRVTLAPVVVLLGYAIVMFAIFFKPKES